LGNWPFYLDSKIKCVDLGGNTDTGSTTFNVKVDTGAPIVVRVYKEENYLKLITDEEADCVYNTDDCEYSFEDGILMTTIEVTEHFTDWSSEFTYYIKCKDVYGNQPFSNECSIVVRPYDVY